MDLRTGQLPRHNHRDNFEGGLVEPRIVPFYTSGQVEHSTTSATFVSVKSTMIAFAGGHLPPVVRIKAVITMKVNDAANTGTARLKVGSSTYSEEVTTQSTSYVTKYLTVETAVLGDGNYSVDLEMKRDAGTVYNDFLNIWVEF